ncbi:MAG: type II toxin-antitoxin system YafQ family toxin [Thermodesulfobacteriota bacterium]|nr:type II toxin-antitoxin system YafQ family toxin [Thermodesulfobacteriota bacterium]
MRRLSQTRQFSRDVRRMAKRGKDIAKLKEVVTRLAEELPLDPRHQDHPLMGKFIKCRDCHVEPDWILIYSMDQESLRLERTGTHSDLFRK